MQSNVAANIKVFSWKPGFYLQGFIGLRVDCKVMQIQEINDTQNK